MAKKRSTFKGEAKVVNVVSITTGALIGSMLGIHAPSEHIRSVYAKLGKLFTQLGQEPRPKGNPAHARADV